jgi:endonuclease/exonuclease/phosphatase family metal-dependent hydrolase
MFFGDETRPLQLKFATWNLAQAKREEAFEETRFDVRWPCIKQMLKAYDADILCLQELRDLDSSQIKVADLLWQLAKECGYDHKHAFYGPDQFSFALAVLYKRDRFFVQDMRLQVLPQPLVLNNQGQYQSKVALMLQFKALETGQQFRVINTQFGLEEQEKTVQSHALGKYLQSIREEPFLCAGDFNFFDDQQGIQQRRILLEDAWTRDLAFPLENASGTFMGYQHDNSKKDFLSMSRLDHIFSQQSTTQRPLVFEPQGPAVAWGDMQQVRDRTYPSDHLMITMQLSLSQ